MIEFKELENGFEYIEVKNGAACGKIALQGGHLFHFARNGEEPILWLSDTSDFKIGTAIRGGVPICWPSFGMNNPDLPQHGFARVGMWKLENSKEIDANTTQITLVLNDTQESLGMWNYKFELELKITISDKLTMELTTTNLDEKPFKLTQALHTYFQISDISNITIKGLSGKPYLDALTNKVCQQNGDITFEQEVDCVYQEVDNKILLVDKNRTITIQNKGSSSVVVWNPWIQKCKRMSAIENDAYKEFVCIESANAYDDFKILLPHAKHTLKAVIY
ncbi:MAG: D-hexose-6-phosphate mutarotase [Campylobacterales bacterium]|nr:D-hexose-6-phosphate mutarotase [Campylobacterales bacterium]